METANVATYLDPYGYKAAGPSDWTSPPGKSPGAPTLKLAVNGHGEKSSHTFYALTCQLSADVPSLSIEWLAQRRLAQLREDLHDIVKTELGKGYDPYFSKAPFAKRGGPSGTTERLQKWLEALASCVNEGVATPSLVAQVLRFLEAPQRDQQEDQEDNLMGEAGIPDDAPMYEPENPRLMRRAACGVRTGEEAPEAQQQQQREGGASPSAGSRRSPARSESSEPCRGGAPRGQPGAAEPGAPDGRADAASSSSAGSPRRRPEAPGSSTDSPGATLAGGGVPTSLASDAASLAEPADPSSPQLAERGGERGAGAPDASAPAAGLLEAGFPVPEAAPKALAPAPAPPAPAAQAAKAPAAQPAPAARAPLAEEEASVGSDMVSLYLAPFGYMVASPEEWQQAPKRSFGTPTLALSVNGHEERDSHTYYDVHCWFVAKRPSLHVEWLAQRRLASLREELHNNVKNELGRSYSDVFAKAPFAKRGGLSGTTLRLQRWLEALATCVNDGTAPPALVAQVLLFLGAPAQTEHHAASGASEAARTCSSGDDRSRSRDRSSSAGRRSSRSGVETAALGAEPGSGRPRPPFLQLPTHQTSFGQQPLHQGRDAADRGSGSCDEGAEGTTDDEAPSSYSPEKRRAGYEKLREWFKELKRRLESRVKRQSTSISPSPRRMSDS